MKGRVTSMLSLVMLAPICIAAEMQPEAEAVWSVVVSSWEDEVAENARWPAEYVHDDAVSWNPDWPLPQDKPSFVDWQRFNAESSQILKHQLFPMKIVVVGNTAAAYYAAVTVSEDAQGNREREVFGLVETLVREGSDWKFLSLSSFPLGETN